MLSAQLLMFIHECVSTYTILHIYKSYAYVNIHTYTETCTYTHIYMYVYAYIHFRLKKNKEQQQKLDIREIQTGIDLIAAPTLRNKEQVEKIINNAQKVTNGNEKMDF